MWARERTTHATRGAPAPPLRVGIEGHPCQACGAFARYEHSPLNYRACSKACFDSLPVPDYVRAEHRRRNA